MRQCQCCGCTQQQSLAIVTIRLNNGGIREVVLCNGMLEGETSSHIYSFLRSFREYESIRVASSGDVIKCESCVCSRVSALGRRVDIDNNQIVCDYHQSFNGRYRALMENQEVDQAILSRPNLQGHATVKSLSDIIKETKESSGIRPPRERNALESAKLTYDSLEEYGRILGEFIEREGIATKYDSYNRMIDVTGRWESKKVFVFMVKASQCKLFHIGGGVVFQPRSNNKTRGIIIQNDDTKTIKVAVLLENHIYNNNSNVSYKLRLSPNIIPFERQAASLSIFVSKTNVPFWESVFLGQIDQVNNQNRINAGEYCYPHDIISTNSSQKICLRNALKHKFSIIQGPPGTGKTTTIACLAWMLLKQNKNIRICVVAHSNSAADNAAEKLCKFNLNPLRIYGSNIEECMDMIKPRMMHISSYTLAVNKLKENNEHDEDKIHQTERDIINEHHLYCTTTCCSGGKRFRDVDFDVVIVDEATQCLDPDILIPFIRNAKKLVLFGDHKQISPFVKSSECKSNGYDVSLIERYNNLGYKIKMLKCQYRMHPAIARFASKTFYNDEISDSDKLKKKRQFPCEFPWQEKDFPIIFWHDDTSESPSSSEVSIKNNRYREMTVKLLEHFESKGIDAKRICVMTPYNGQLDYYDDKPSANNEEGVQIDYYSLVEKSTVDSQQGRENDIIIFDTVRSNLSKTIGFLDNDKRLNVALTRAKYGMIVIGNTEMYRSFTAWSKFIDYCYTHKSVIKGEFGHWQPYKPSFCPLP